MADQEAKKILSGVWGSSDAAQRMNPEEAGIDRRVGWHVGYEQPGSGSEPEREVVTQRWREIDGWAAHHMRTGGYHEYDAEVDYFQWARCIVEGHKYYCVEANGPALGNAVSPTTPGQQVWRLY